LRVTTLDTQPLVAVVDDDASIRKALRRMLRASGYAVETFESAAEFLAQSSLLPACLVLDVRMPETSGLDLQRQLAESHPALPVVMITGHGSEAVRDRAVAAGAVAVLDKPFHDRRLLDAIERALQARCAHRV
jgi:FixJ family two-component response regulator